MFSGSLVALTTPMDRYGAIEESAIRALVQWHLDDDALAVLELL